METKYLREHRQNRNRRLNQNRTTCNCILYKYEKEWHVFNSSCTTGSQNCQLYILWNILRYIMGSWKCTAEMCSTMQSFIYWLLGTVNNRSNHKETYKYSARYCILWLLLVFQVDFLLSSCCGCCGDSFLCPQLSDSALNTWT